CPRSPRPRPPQGVLPSDVRGRCPRRRQHPQALQPNPSHPTGLKPNQGQKISHLWISARSSRINEGARWRRPQRSGYVVARIRRPECPAVGHLEDLPGVNLIVSRLRISWERRGPSRDDLLGKVEVLVLAEQL